MKILLFHVEYILPYEPDIQDTTGEAGTNS